MLKTLGSDKSTTRPKKGGVGVRGNGGDNGGYDDEHSPRGSRQVYQRTHQLVRPKLWSSMMRLTEVGVMLLKSCQKIEELSKVEKPQKTWKVAKVIGLEKRLPKHRSSVEEFELPLEL